MVSSKSSRSSVKSASMGGSKSMSSMNMLMVLIVVVVILFAIWWFWMRKPSSQKSGFEDTKPIRGYYKFAWEGTSVPLGDWDFGIWFGGEVPKLAIDQNINKAKFLNGNKKLLNLGGGDPKTGSWNLSDFDYINSKLSAIKSAGWDGLCFDVEICPPDISFVEAFKNCFAKCKKAGLIVFVTMSHLVPYACKTGAGQGTDLVNASIADPNVDYISPQLYTKGDELEASDLSGFASVKHKMLPSIPTESDWVDFDKKVNLVCPGYIIWMQNWPRVENICGTNSEDSINNCGERNRCFKGTDSECPSGQKCFKQDECKPNFCGKSWADANTRCQTADKCAGTYNCKKGEECWADITCSKPSTNKPNFCGNSWTDVVANCKTAARCVMNNDECPIGPDGKHQTCFAGVTCK